MHLFHRWTGWSPPFLDADTKLVQCRHCLGCGKLQLRNIVAERSPYSPSPTRPPFRPHWSTQ